MIRKLLMISVFCSHALADNLPSHKEQRKPVGSSPPPSANKIGEGSSKKQNSEEALVKNLSVREVKGLIDKGEALVVVDVRQKWEWDLCHLENSVLIPLDDLEERWKELPQDGRLLLTLCRHGIRSAVAARILQNKGMANVANIEGGIHEWSLVIDPSLPTY